MNEIKRGSFYPGFSEEIEVFKAGGTGFFELRGIAPPSSGLMNSPDIVKLCEQIDSVVGNFGKFTYEEVRACKGELKKRLKVDISPQDRQLLEDVKKRYDSFAQADVILKEMKRLGQILKKKEDGSYAPQWFESYTDRILLDQFERFLQGDITKYEKTRRVFAKTMIWEAYREIYPFRDRNIQWIHGSTSAALPLMRRFQSEIGEEGSALVPTGILLKHNMAPLSGELGPGIGGINRTALSGMGLYALSVAESYARRSGFFGGKTPVSLYVMDFEQEKRIIDDYQGSDIKNLSIRSLSRLKVSVLRLLLMRPENVEIDRIKDQIKELKQKIDKSLPPLFTDWRLFGGYIGESAASAACRKLDFNEKLERGQLVVIEEKKVYGIVSRYDNNNKQYSVITDKKGEGTIESVMFFDPSGMQVLEQPLEPKPLEVDLVQMDTLDKELESIYHLFDTVRPLELNSEERNLIGSSFPIVWASCTLRPVYFSSGIRGEIVVQQSAKLGADIQLAFTDKEHMETLRKQVFPFGVAVMSFEAADLKKMMPQKAE